MSEQYYKIRFHYAPHQRVTFATTGESLTKQSHKKECDINEIMKKWEKTGILEHRNNFEGQYGDFINTPGDYAESMNAVLDANDMFDALPSKIRRRFGNDPGTFLDFATDPENNDEMIKLGLAPKPHEPKVIEDPKPAPTPPPEPPKTPPKEAL